MGSYLRLNLLGPGLRLMKKVFAVSQSHKSWETLLYTDFEVKIVIRSRMINLERHIELMLKYEQALFFNFDAALHNIFKHNWIPFNILNEIPKKFCCLVSNGFNANSFIHYYSAVKAGFGRNQSTVMWPVWLWCTAPWARSWG